MAVPAFAAADWGTTRLRVWLLDADGAIIAERRSDEGLLSVAAGGFEAVLERHLSTLGAASDLPVMLCGMVGSRQGWIEVPYVDLPAGVDAVLSRAVRVPGIRRDVRIIPGAAQRRTDRPDVMRGEETQLAGAIAITGNVSLACQPGTHSKWVKVESGKAVEFSTWMTGELFSTLSIHTILRHSIGVDTHVDPSSAAFAQWLARGRQMPGDLTGSVFAIRAAGLLFSMSNADAAAALSGLMIGAELGSAEARYGHGNVSLISSGALGDLYKAALDASGWSVTVIDADAAVRAGLTAAARLNFNPG